MPFGQTFPGRLVVLLAVYALLDAGAARDCEGTVVGRLVSLVLLVISVYVLMRFAAKVFEVAMLMYGKSAALREIWRWGIRSSHRFGSFER